jgi:hypothetical protein
MKLSNGTKINQSDYSNVEPLLKRAITIKEKTLGTEGERQIYPDTNGLFITYRDI